MDASVKICILYYTILLYMLSSIRSLTFPAVLELSGGGGGLFEHRSHLLASQSYVSLVLQYLTDFSTTVAIGCKYFEVFVHFIVEKDATGLKCVCSGVCCEPVAPTSLCWDHPQVASDRVAVFGFSLGILIPGRLLWCHLRAYSTPSSLNLTCLIDNQLISERKYCKQLFYRCSVDTTLFPTYGLIIQPRCMVCISGSHVFPFRLSLVSIADKYNTWVCFNLF